MFFFVNSFPACMWLLVHVYYMKERVTGYSKFNITLQIVKIPSKGRIVKLIYGPLQNGPDLF